MSTQFFINDNIIGLLCNGLLAEQFHTNINATSDYIGVADQGYSYKE